MRSETNQPDYNLVSKYLAGEATPAEAMLVHDWIADPENKKAFDQMLKTWNMLPGASTMQSPSEADSWSHIQTALTRAPVKKFSFRKIIRYAVAAAITGVLLLVTIIWSDRTKQANSYIVQSAGTEVKKHNMADGSVIFINKNSTLAYSELYNKKNRKVRLEGEAFFTVKPDHSKPFIVEAEGVAIKVTGTAFNVRKLHEEERIEVQVQTGSVEMYTTQHKITVNKGQTGIYDKRHRSLALKDGLDVNSISYATKSFSFNDLTLREAARYLENAFDVSIQMDEATFSDCRITAAFDNKSLTYILEVINATLNTTYRKKGNTIIIEGEGCK
jgi:transmembrane sensor